MWGMITVDADVPDRYSDTRYPSDSYEWVEVSTPQGTPASHAFLGGHNAIPWLSPLAQIPEAVRRVSMNVFGEIDRGLSAVFGDEASHWIEGAMGLASAYWMPWYGQVALQGFAAASGEPGAAFAVGASLPQLGSIGRDVVGQLLTARSWMLLAAKLGIVAATATIGSTIGGSTGNAIGRIAGAVLGGFMGAQYAFVPFQSSGGWVPGSPPVAGSPEASYFFPGAW